MTGLRRLPTKVSCKDGKQRRDWGGRGGSWPDWHHCCHTPVTPGSLADVIIISCSGRPRPAGPRPNTGITAFPLQYLLWRVMLAWEHRHSVQEAPSAGRPLLLGDTSQLMAAPPSQVLSLSPPRCEGGAPHHPLICHCVVAGSRPPLLVQSLLAGRDCGSTERVRQAGTEAVCSPPPLHTTTTHTGHITHWPWPWLWPWP